MKAAAAKHKVTRPESRMVSPSLGLAFRNAPHPVNGRHIQRQGSVAARIYATCCCFAIDSAIFE
jgi:hypothetical protein